MCKERGVQRRLESGPVCSDLSGDVFIKGDTVGWMIVMSSESCDEESGM